MNLNQLALAKRSPEFASAIQDISYAFQHAARMHGAGKLSKGELANFEGHLWKQYIEALPNDTFAEMMEDGRLDELLALAGHDESQNVYDAEQERQEVVKKVKADALDDAWLAQKIDSKTYAELSREHHVDRSDDLDDQMANEDFDGAASEMFASRHDAASSQAGALSKWLSEKYGGETVKGEKFSWNYERSDELPKEEAAPERDSQGRDANGFIDLDALSNEEQA